MADAIYLERDYTTNGVTIPAGKVSTDDLRDLIRDDKGQPLSEEAAKTAQQDLLQRQGKYAEYAKGIHERREVSHNGGSIAMGGNG